MCLVLSTNHVILKNLIESQYIDLNKTDKFIYREKIVKRKNTQDNVINVCKQVNVTCRNMFYVSIKTITGYTKQYNLIKIYTRQYYKFMHKTM